MTERFDETYYQGNAQGGDRIALRFYARVAGRLAPRGARALEFGCGTGHLSRRLARRYRSSAYDISDYARDTTRRTSPSTEVLDDLGAIADGTFDLIVSLHVLEHVPDPPATFADLARWLAPGGRLMYVVPNPQGLGHRIKRERWFAYRDETHCSLLDRDAWVGLAWRAGLVVERVHADGLWDPPYVPRVPRLLQLAVLGAPAALQVALGRLFLPADWGECIVVVARRPRDPSPSPLPLPAAAESPPQA